MRLKSALRRGVAAAVIAGIVVSSGIPAYAKTWNIAEGDITVKGASDESGNYNNVKQGDKDFEKDTDTVITGESDKSTVTIDTSKGNVDVTFDDLKINVSGKAEGDVSDKTEVDGNDDGPVRESNVAVTVKGGHDATIELDGDNELKSGGKNAGLEKNEHESKGTLTIKDDKGKDGSLTAEGGEGGGAGIGGGGSYGTDGAEVEPDICALNPGGKIEYYAPRSSMSGTPNKTVTNPTGDFVWDSGTVTTPATCTGKGVRTYTCTSSSHTKTEDIPALNHSFAGQEYVSDNNATCEQDGTKTAKCVRYGTGGCMATDTVTDTDSKLGHLFEDYISNNDATYARDGTKTAKCVRYDQCGETHTVPDEGSRLKLPLYRVTDRDGRDIAYTAEQTGGVLTVTVDEDFAVLTGRLSGLRTLKAQGVEKIVFVTKGATSAFLLSDLTEKGESSEAYRLTHDTKAVTFTLGDKMTDVSAILTKP